MSPSPVTSRITRPDAVDDSCRLPVLKFALGALAWLVVGLIFAIGASVTLYQPGLAACEYVTHGKLAAVARTALVYGFASQAGLAVAIWLLARLGDAPVKTGIALLAGSVFWNLGVGVGVMGILCGEQSGIAYFDFPGYAGSILLVAYVLTGVSLLTSFGLGVRGPLRLPQWFVLSALMWFPWLLATAQIFLVWFPVRGVLQAVIGGWYTQGLFWGWLTPLTLGALFHFLPELTGKSLPHRSLALLGFWVLLLLAGWTGTILLVGGPVPAWIASLGVVVGTLLILPVVFLSLNLHVWTGSSSMFGHPALALARFASLSFTAGGAIGALTSLRCSNRILHFTLFPQALTELGLLGFVGLGLLAALYIILPRLVGFAWHQPLLSLAQVLFSGVGLSLSVVAYAVAGWRQGLQLDVAATPLATVNSGVSVFLVLHTLGLVVFLVGQLAFAAHLAALIFRHFPTVKSFALTLITPESTAGSSVAVTAASAK